MLLKDLTQDAVFKSISTMEQNHRPLDLEMMSELKLMYNNQSKPIRVPGVSDRIYLGRKECWTPVSFTAMLVDKISSVLYGRAVTRTIGVEDLDVKLARLYQMNKSAFLRVSKVASLCGYGAIRIRRRWDGTITFDTYGFSEVTPILDSVDPFGRPEGLVFSVLTTDLPVWASEQLSSKHSVYNFTEIITRNKRDDKGEITEVGAYRAFVNDKEIATPSNGINPLGDYLGAVYWRGLDHPFEEWGKSDILPLYETLVALNELMTDGRELVVWGLHSPVVITNSDGQVKWEYSPRSIINVSGEATVTRLSSGTQTIGDFEIFINRILNMFHQTSRVPSVATGDLNGIGKASSGRAFEIAMIPIRELIDEKENVCVPQEIELIKEVIAKMAYYNDIKGYTELKDGIWIPDVKKINELTKDATVDFAPISFPDVVVGETLSGQVMGGIRSQKDAIATLHEDWTPAQVDEEVKRIEADRSQGTDALATSSIDTLRNKLGNK